MKLFNRIGILSAALFLCSVIEIQAYLPRSDLQVSGGWRRDDYHLDYVYQAPEGFSTAFEDISAKNINVWEVGVRGVLSPQSCGCCACWFDQFYLRGSAYWGWFDNGHWNDTYNVIPATADDLTIQVGKAHKGHTRDYDIAIGWLYPFCFCDFIFGIGPVGGYSYHYLDFKLHDLRDEANFTDPSANNGEKITSKFQGPYAGIDLQFGWCNFLISTGYEYHWVTKWRGRITVPEVPSIDYYSDIQRANRGFGNVAYVNADWQLCDCFEFGVGFKYRYFKTFHGSSEPVNGFEAEGFPPFAFISTNAKWKSYEVQLNLGFTF